MAFTLYDATVRNYLQILGSTRDLVGKARDWAAEQGKSEEDIASLRLCDDMLDFAYQVKSVAFHSQSAIEGCRGGEFQPDMSKAARSFDGMTARLDEAIAFMEGVTPEDMDALIGTEMAFVLPQRDVRLPFLSEDFLMSFSLPNFYFHATTAYDLLRAEGMPLGKPDFLGRMRLNKG